MVMPNSPVSLPGNDNKKLYNGGSEWQKDFGNKPDYYQTFYRNYDAAIGRWISVDPEAESAESMTSYQYGGNNPVMMNDPLGNRPVEQHADNFLALNNAITSGATLGEHGFAEGSGPNSMAAWEYIQTGGLYARDPGAAAAMVTTGQVQGVNIYTAGNPSENTPSTGSLSAALGLLNQVSISNGGEAGFNGTTSSYLDNKGRTLLQTYYDGGPGGIKYYNGSVTVVNGNTVVTGDGEITANFISTGNANNDARISELNPYIRETAAEFVSVLLNCGLNVRITESFRSIETQNEYYASGRTTPGPIRTGAIGGKSFHQYGLAFDIYVVSPTGALQSLPDWGVGLGKYFYGFEWGGEFTNLIDLPHFQITLGQTVGQLFRKSH